MRVLDADPKLDRQVSPAGLVLLWRGRRGGREGLLLVLQVCPFPLCPIRHVDLQAYRVDDALVSVELDGDRLLTRAWEGSAPPRFAFLADVDVDLGTFTHVTDGPRADRQAVTWLERALDGELLARIREFFERERRAADERR